MMEAKEKLGKVQVVIDFSFLKSAAEKGGIILTTVSCPYCGGRVELPKAGDTLRCVYCNKLVYATDIFAKLKDLLGSIVDKT